MIFKFKIKGNVLNKYRGNEETVMIPDSVTVIGARAFKDCKNLKKVVIPDSVTKIGDWAFENCINLREIEIPNSVTSIGIGAFGMCSNLTKIKIPNSVTVIGADAFKACDNLTIYGNQNSYAETYAKENNIPFKVKINSDKVKLVGHHVTEETARTIDDITTFENQIFQEWNKI